MGNGERNHSSSYPTTSENSEFQQHPKQKTEANTGNNLIKDDIFEENGEKGGFDVWLETRKFLELAGVSSMIKLGWNGSRVVTASYVGRNFDSVYLSAFSLAILTGNLCNGCLLQGLYSASDTLSPQAFGKGDLAEVGRIAIRGYVIACVTLFPIIAAFWCHLETIMIALGQDAEAAMLASQWYRVYAFTLPFSAMFESTYRFLTTQHTMKPLIYVAFLCTGFILPLSLTFCTRSMGFVGSAVAFVIFEASQALTLVFYLWWNQPHDSRTWPGISRESILSTLEWKRMNEFIHLGMGGLVAQCEWVFWEAIGLVAGKVSVLALSVQTIPIQTVVGFAIGPFSCGLALAVRMGIWFPISVKRTKWIVLSASVFSMIAFGLFSILLYVKKDFIVSLFTTDDDVKELADMIWLKVSLFNWNLAGFAILTGVATGLGQQWPLGIINFACSMMFGLPLIYYKAVVLGQGLNAIWFWMNIMYLCINLSLVVLFVVSDWDRIRDKILLSGDKINREVDNDVEEEFAAIADEATSLL